MKATDAAVAGRLDPVPVLKGFASLRRLVGTYPPGHPMIGQKLHELDQDVRRHLQHGPELCIDIVPGSVHLKWVAYEGGDQAVTHVLLELSELGVDSLHISEGVETEELRAVAEFLWQPRASDEPLAAQLARRNVRHLSL